MESQVKKYTSSIARTGAALRGLWSISEGWTCLPLLEECFEEAPDVVPGLPEDVLVNLEFPAIRLEGRIQFFQAGVAFFDGWIRVHLEGPLLLGGISFCTGLPGVHPAPLRDGLITNVHNLPFGGCGRSVGAAPHLPLDEVEEECGEDDGPEDFQKKNCKLFHDLVGLNLALALLVLTKRYANKGFLRT